MILWFERICHHDIEIYVHRSSDGERGNGWLAICAVATAVAALARWEDSPSRTLEDAPWTHR